MICKCNLDLSGLSPVGFQVSSNSYQEHCVPPVEKYCYIQNHIKLKKWRTHKLYSTFTPPEWWICSDKRSVLPQCHHGRACLWSRPSAICSKEKHVNLYNNIILISPAFMRWDALPLSSSNTRHTMKTYIP